MCCFSTVVHLSGRGYNSNDYVLPFQQRGSKYPQNYASYHQGFQSANYASSYPSSPNTSTRTYGTSTVDNYVVPQHIIEYKPNGPHGFAKAVNSLQSTSYQIVPENVQNAETYDNNYNPKGHDSKQQGQYYRKVPSVDQYPERIQSRFHPTTFEEDSHTGEIIESSVPATQVFPQEVQGPFSLQTSNQVAVQVPDPGTDTLTPPPLPSGYDYNPTPQPLPPQPLVSTSHIQGPYYYPIPNQYILLPTGVPPQQLVAQPPPGQPPAAQPPPVSPTPDEERQVDYTYYYLGPKLWYVPLFFSIYFVIYVGALIIKAISKHKILFPQHLYDAATTVAGRGVTGVDLITSHVIDAMTNAAVKYVQTKTIGNS